MLAPQRWTRSSSAAGDGEFASLGLANLLAALDHAEEYRVLAMRSRDRGEREAYERIVELYIRIAEELEVLMGG
jgi:hypothetical protein